MKLVSKKTLIIKHKLLTSVHVLPFALGRKIYISCYVGKLKISVDKKDEEEEEEKKKDEEEEEEEKEEEERRRVEYI